MRAKYPPKVFSVNDVKPDGSCTVKMKCNKCSTENSFVTDILHWNRMLCPQCLQRHYVDPFEFIIHSQERIKKIFNKYETVVLWGAGEICIKLLDNYSIFRNSNFKVVDISRSRQGYSVCGKKIFAPEIINEEKISNVVATVVQRKDEILQQIKNSFSSVSKIYLPGIEKTEDRITLVLKNIYCENIILE